MQGDAGVPPGLTQTYYKSIAPRIGLAWSPAWNTGWRKTLSGGPDKTSIRLGWGIFYNPIEQLVLEQFSGAADIPVHFGPVCNRALNERQL